MSRKHKRSKPLPPSPQAVSVPGTLGIAVLSSVALLVSLYLLWGSLRGEHLPGCGPSSGCDDVLGSRWSVWLGVPVSLPAVLTYVALLLGLTLLRRTKEAETRIKIQAGLAALGVAILGAAVWFVFLQLFVIRAICPFCMIAHGCGLGVGLLLLRATRTERGFSGGAIAGAAVLALLVAGQIFYPPAGYEISTVPAATLQTSNASPGAPLNSSDAVDSSRPTTEPAPEPALSPTPSRRLLQVHEGLFALDLNEVPVIGSPNAPQVVLHFFDYSCDHCRALHGLLTNVQHALGERVAMVNLPIPLEPDCNPIMKRRLAAHTNACAYAKLGLAVWRADRAQLEGFDDWIFSFPRPPHPEVVRREAENRVGREALGKALQDPWIDDYLALGIRIYHTNYLRFGKAQLPLLMTGTNLVSGTVRSTNDLYRILGMTP